MKLGLTADQITQRRQGIGGSDAGRIWSGDWVSLFREKTGRAEPEDLLRNLAVQMGSATEAFNAHWYTFVTGRDVHQCGDRVASQNYPFMVANLDGVSTTAAGATAYWDAKHVGRLDERTILRYTPQMVHCCTILGLDWWVLSVFVGNSKHEIIEQEVDAMFAAELIEKEREFWSYVERDIEPPDMTPQAVPKPAPRFREVTVDLNPDAPPTENWHLPLVAEVTRFTNTHGAATVNTLAREKIKELLPEDVGACHVGLVDITRSKVGAVTISLKRLAEVEKEDGP